MNQVAIFFCAFAVLSGVYAGDTTSASSDSTSIAEINTVSTFFAEFKEYLLAANQAANATAIAALEKATDDLETVFEAIIEKLEAIDNPTIAEVIDATIAVYKQKINTSDMDTIATTAVLAATFVFIETEIITSSNLAYAIVNATAVLFSPADSTEYGSTLEAIITKIASVSKTVYTALVEAATADLTAMGELMKTVINQLETEIESTSNVWETQMSLLKTIWQTITGSS